MVFYLDDVVLLSAALNDEVCPNLETWKPNPEARSH
jgi:hypothetical protein